MAFVLSVLIESTTKITAIQTFFFAPQTHTHKHHWLNSIFILYFFDVDSRSRFFIHSWPMLRCVFVSFLFYFFSAAVIVVVMAFEQLDYFYTWCVLFKRMFFSHYFFLSTYSSFYYDDVCCLMFLMWFFVCFRFTFWLHVSVLTSSGDFIFTTNDSIPSKEPK